MNFRRLFERSRVSTRSFLLTSLALTCCGVAISNGDAFAQNGATNVDSQDARILRFLSGDSTASVATVPTFADAARENAKPSSIRQVSAAYPAAKPAPIRQAQYSEEPQNAATYKAAPLAPSSSQLALGGNPGALDSPYVDACPDPNDMPSILDVPYKIVPKPGLFPENCPLPDEDYQRKPPTPITFTWKASSLCYKPLYFEDVQLERYGHYCHPLLQPFASRARFWLTIPVLPYLMGVNPPNECVYDLGYYRPGDCAPSMLQPVPISLRGALFEAGAVVGAAAIIP